MPASYLNPNFKSRVERRETRGGVLANQSLHKTHLGGLPQCWEEQRRSQQSPEKTRNQESISLPRCQEISGANRLLFFFLLQVSFMTFISLKTLGLNGIFKFLLYVIQLHDQKNTLCSIYTIKRKRLANEYGMVTREGKMDQDFIPKGTHYHFQRGRRQVGVSLCYTLERDLTHRGFIWVYFR